MTHILYDYEQYLSTKCYSETTKQVYLINVRLFLDFIRRYKGRLNTIVICNITRADIQNYIAYMSNLKESTIKNRLTSVKSFYLFLNSNLSNYLFKDIKVFNLDIKLPKYLFSQEITSILNYYSDKRNYLIIFLFLNTGIRISELANIQIQNINFQKKYIYLKVKGGHYRNVYINEETKQKLLEYIGDRTEGNLFGIKRRAIDYIVKKPMKECGIRGSAHTLRHTFATVMYKKTHDILLVKELLGHKEITSTMIYTHLDNETIKRAVESNPLAKYEIGGMK